MNNEFLQNGSTENLKEESILNNPESKESLETELTNESSEDFAIEKINLLNAKMNETTEMNEAENAVITKLDGDLSEIEHLISDVDSEIKNLGSEAIKEIVRWIKLDNPTFNEDNFYRVINENGYKDFIDNKIVRSSPTGTDSKMIGSLSMSRPTSFPSFAKGTPDLSYAKNGEDNYVLESDTPMYRFGEINPVTRKEIRGRHWAYRPLNEDGSWKKEISPEEIKNVYKIDQNGDVYLKNNIDSQNKKEVVNNNIDVDIKDTEDSEME